MMPTSTPNVYWILAASLLATIKLSLSDWIEIPQIQVKHYQHQPRTTTPTSLPEISRPNDNLEELVDRTVNNMRTPNDERSVTPHTGAVSTPNVARGPVRITEIPSSHSSNSQHEINVRRDESFELYESYEDDEDDIVAEDEDEDDEYVDDIDKTGDNSNESKADDNGNGPHENNGSLFSAAGFLPFLKSIQSTLISNGQKKQSTAQKIHLLEEIKDQLFTNIEYRINSLWGTPLETGARGYSTHKDGHEYESGVDFPSNAAALLALSFLTFAVYLIKLILQVCQVLQNHNATTTTGRRRRRSTAQDYDNQAWILHLMESFSFD